MSEPLPEYTNATTAPRALFIGGSSLALVALSAWLHASVPLALALTMTGAWYAFQWTQINRWIFFAREWRRFYYEVVEAEQSHRRNGDR